MYMAVAMGGMIGGVCRWLMLEAWPAETGEIPLALLAANAAGSGVIGLVLAFSEPGGRRRLPPALSLGLMAGFCGALTSFSTFALESLIRANDPACAIWHVVVSLAVWLAAAAFGLLAGRWMNLPPERPGPGKR